MNNMRANEIARGWFCKRIPDEGIVNYLDSVLDYAKKNIIFYDNERKKKRFPSRAMRIIAVFSIAVGAFFTAIQVTLDSDESQFWAALIMYIGFALGSSLLLIDRQFGISKVYLTAIQTRMEIEKVVSDFHAQFIKLVSSSEYSDLSDDELKNELSELQIELFLKFDQTLRTIVINETDLWVANLNKEMENLSKSVNEKLSLSKTELITKKEVLQEGRAKNNTAYVNIAIYYPTLMSGTISLSQNDKVSRTKDIIVGTKSVQFSNLRTGIHSFKLSFKLQNENLLYESNISLLEGINNFSYGAG